MDQELRSLELAVEAAARHGWQVILLDQVDGVWTAQAGHPDPKWEVKDSATGSDRKSCLDALALKLNG